LKYAITVLFLIDNTKAIVMPVKFLFIILFVFVLFLTPVLASETEKESYNTVNEMTDKEAAGRFGKRLGVENISLSPNGKYAAFLSGGLGPETKIHWIDLASGTIKLVFATGDSLQKAKWCDFVANDRLICSIDVIKNDGNDIIPFNRLISVNLDGSNIKVLGQRSKHNETSIRQSSGYIIDWLPNEDGIILMAQTYVPTQRINSRLERKEKGLGVVRLNTRTNKSKKLEKPIDGVSRYLADNHGNVRIALFPKYSRSSGYLTGEMLYRYRLKGERKWQLLGTYNNDGDDFWPAAIDDETNSVFGLKKKDGREALYTMSLDGQKKRQLIYEHPKVDLSGIVGFGQGGRVVGVRFSEDKDNVVYFDPRLKKLAGQLSRALLDLPLIEFVDASTDENILLIHAASDSDPGRYFILDRSTKKMTELMLARPVLENIRLSKVHPIKYAAGDGTQIPGYLTLPPGVNRETAKNIPTILMPHGGPASRDTWGFDWMAQFFANRGYAVLQPNFRGSAGYGDDWYVDNGFQSWKIAIGDINDGARWLIKEGIADKDGLAIIGWSYGGYAALQSGVHEPGLFKAIVAVAPVTDLILTISESKNFTNFRLVQKQIGSGPLLKQGSPLQNTSKIQVPVLLFHGDKDINVDVRQSRRMAAALENAQKDVTYIEYKGLKHQLSDSRVRSHMLFQIATFLKQKLR